jgi:hypothetical protein
MTSAEIIQTIREGFLFDKSEPYTWSDNLLELFLNDAEREACRRSSLLVDKATASDSESSPLPLCSLNLVAETSAYTISQKIIRIRKCVPSWNSISLLKKTEGWLNEMYPEWRTATGAPVYFLEEKGEITLVPEPIANDTKTVSGITRSGTTATVNHPSHDYDDGATITFDDADQAEYNVTAIIAKIDDDYYSYTVSGTPDTPATGTITATLIDTLILEVQRLPLADVTLSGEESPEISAEYHMSLIDWVAYRALGNHDKDTEHIRKSLTHEALFTQRFGPPISAITEGNRRRRPKNNGLRAKEFGF